LLLRRLNLQGDAVADSLESSDEVRCNPGGVEPVEVGHFAFPTRTVHVINHDEPAPS